MGKTISLVLVILLFITILFIAFISPTQTAENAEDKVLDAKKEVLNAMSDLNKASRVSDAEYQQFKTDLDNRITDFEKSVAELQQKYSTNNTKRKAFYITNLAALEPVNSGLKVKLTDYKAE
jgi:Na+-transporting NADH:ubiquinone oxidoreductase subunit NqrC